MDTSSLNNERELPSRQFGNKYGGRAGEYPLIWMFKKKLVFMTWSGNRYTEIYYNQIKDIQTSKHPFVSPMPGGASLTITLNNQETLSDVLFSTIEDAEHAKNTIMDEVNKSPTKSTSSPKRSKDMPNDVDISFGQNMSKRMAFFVYLFLILFFVALAWYIIHFSRL